jgi:hypothetical protein
MTGTTTVGTMSVRVRGIRGKANGSAKPTEYGVARREYGSA